jgi:predicted ArsR family transcriptional regulator
LRFWRTYRPARDAARSEVRPRLREMAKRMPLGVLRVLANLLEPTREELYRYVTHVQRSVNRDEAAAAVGISRAMAAFHLDRLVEAGLLRAEYRRLSGRTGRGAGRPAKLYRRSRRRFDVTVPQRDHELLARLLAESLSRGAASSPAQEVAADYGHSLGIRAGRRTPSRAQPEQLARCVADVMTDLGFEPTPTDAGHVRARNCPFDPISRQLPSVVCHTAVALLGGVVDGVGARDLEVTRRERPTWCCVVLTSPRTGKERPSGASSAAS